MSTFVTKEALRAFDRPEQEHKGAAERVEERHGGV
jgi:hypothetical protein